MNFGNLDVMIGKYWLILSGFLNGSMSLHRFLAKASNSEAAAIMILANSTEYVLKLSDVNSTNRPHRSRSDSMDRKYSKYGWLIINSVPGQLGPIVVLGY